MYFIHNFHFIATIEEKRKKTFTIEQNWSEEREKADKIIEKKWYIRIDS